MKTNVLYYGDNLDILRKYIPDESVDLVYLDPPFNSNASYNVIFKDESGRKSDAQIVAFDDTWHWGPSPEAHYAYLTNTATGDTYNCSASYLWMDTTISEVVCRPFDVTPGSTSPTNSALRVSPRRRSAVAG